MQQQDSYSEFMPLRQSSLLTDETLLMNGTDVYANVTVIWPAGHAARELELERARIEFEALANGVPYVSMCDSLQETVGNTLSSTLANNSTQQFNESNEDTIWMTALDIPYVPESGNDPNESLYHSVVDFTLTTQNKVDERFVLNDDDDDDGNMNLSLGQISLNDTLPMDEDDGVTFN